MCEVMIRNFSVMEKIPSLIFRLFTVYGPWGRPDMALFKFTKSIINDEPIQIYNEGNHSRSFTYIDDIVHYLKSAALLTSQRITQICGNDSSEVFNLGNPKSHLLSEYIFELEKALKKESKKDFLPLQPGDVLSTLADISKLKGALGEHDFTDISVGVQNFVTWYQHYYSEKSN
jgi:UDP-glucuronate 4-epimerase